MHANHHRGVNSYFDQEYKTKAILKNIILSNEDMTLFRRKTTS